jgi:hypothetical protein
MIAWASTTWDWYWSTLQWAGAAIAFLVAFILLSFGTLAFAAASSYLRRGVGPAQAPDEGPLTWYTNLTLSGGFGNPVRALRFHGSNSSQREVDLRSADITSAVNGARLVLEVRAVNQAGVNEHVPIDRIQLIPPGAPIELIARFNPPDGMEQQAFLATWGKFYLNARDDARVYRIAFNEGSLMAFFPGLVGPRVMQKPKEPARPHAKHSALFGTDAVPNRDHGVQMTVRSPSC